MEMAREQKFATQKANETMAITRLIEKLEELRLVVQAEPFNASMAQMEVVSVARLKAAWAAQKVWADVDWREEIDVWASELGVDENGIPLDDDGEQMIDDGWNDYPDRAVRRD